VRYFILKVYKIECIFNGVNEWVDETKMNVTATPTPIPTPTPTPDNTPAFSAILSNAKEGQCFILDKSGKSFTKIAGMIAAPDMDAYESVRMTVSAEFFNTRVVRIAYARVRRI
jgi:hypothetical protein